MGLIVNHVGAFALMIEQRRQEWEKGDILIECDGRRDFLRETDLLPLRSTRLNRGVRSRSASSRSEERQVEIATPSNEFSMLEAN